MSFESLPCEVFLLICYNLDLKALSELTTSSKYLFNLLDPLLYLQALKSDAYTSKFLFAVIYGQPAAVSKFLKAGVRMSAFKDYKGYDAKSERYHMAEVSREKRQALAMNNFHPFLAAAWYGYIDIVRVLLFDGNANIDFQDNYDKSALHYAIEADHPVIIELLLKQGAGIKDPPKYHITPSPFVHAAQIGHKYAVELMVNELRNRSGQFQLRLLKNQCEKACHIACQKGYVDIVDFLLRQGGVDINFSIRERSLLYCATKAGHMSIVQLLVKYGARMEHERDCGVVYALVHGGSWGEPSSYPWSRLDIIMFLLRSGCNVSNGGLHACALWCIAKCSGSTRHRFYATSEERAEIMSLLVDKGFDEKKCRHNCFKKTGKTSLAMKLREHSLEKYVFDQELINRKC